MRRHIYLLWSALSVSACHDTDVSISWCFKTLFVLLFFPPSSSIRSSLDVILPPFSLPFFSYRAPGVRPSYLNLSPAHIKAIGELERPSLHPCHPLSLPSSSHHHILPLNFKRLFPVTTFLHFSACKCYVIDYYRLHLSHVSSLRCSQCGT